MRQQGSSFEKPEVRRFFLWAGVALTVLGAGALVLNLATGGHSLRVTIGAVFWASLGVLYITIGLIGKRAAGRR